MTGTGIVCIGCNQPIAYGEPALRVVKLEPGYAGPASAGLGYVHLVCPEPVG